MADFVGSDRGLKRLSVTTIDTVDLEHPPVVHLEDRLAEATAALRSAGARWGVVLDDQDRLHGWISADEPTVDGTVATRARRMEAWLPVGASLKAAFAEMLQHDAGWVAVLDGDRFTGVLTPTTCTRRCAGRWSPTRKASSATRSSWTRSARAEVGLLGYCPSGRSGARLTRGVAR